MKIFDLAEILAAFAIVLGCGAITAAAVMVSVPLGVLSAGVFLVLGGLVGVYAATKAEQDSAARAARPHADRP